MTDLTGGVIYGSTLGGTGDSGGDPGGGDEWAGYTWFSPLEFYCSSSFVSLSDCNFWCEACSGQIVPTLVKIADVPPEAPQYPSFTPQNIAALGLCQIFEQWVWSSFWANVTGGTENAPGPPVEPGPPLPIYG